MGADRPRLLVTDLDGTLLDSSGRIPRRCVEAIGSLRSRGFQFTLATGRTARSASVFARILDVDIPLVVYNGARVEDPWPEDAIAPGQVVLDCQLAISRLLLLLELARQTPGVQVIVHIQNDLYAERMDTRVLQHLGHDRVACTVVEDLVECMLWGGCTKACLFSAPDTLQAFEAAYARRVCSAFGVTPASLAHLVSFVHSEPYLLEVLPPGCNKGSGLVALCRFLGIPLAEVVTVGDSRNDVEMIRTAGMGVSVGNAHPELKEAGSMVVGTNDECGVAQVVEELFLAR